MHSVGGMIVVVVRHQSWFFPVSSCGDEPLVCVAISVSQDEIVDVDHFVILDPGTHFVVGSHVLDQFLLDRFLGVARDLHPEWGV